MFELVEEDFDRLEDGSVLELLIDGRSIGADSLRYTAIISAMNRSRGQIFGKSVFELRKRCRPTVLEMAAMNRVAHRVYRGTEIYTLTATMACGLVRCFKVCAVKYQRTYLTGTSLGIFNDEIRNLPTGDCSSC